MRSPVLPTDYALCGYDTSLPAPNRLFAARAEGASTCGGRPCWVARGIASAGAISFKYRDAEGASDGIVRVTLRPGGDNKAKIALKAAGANLTIPALPLEPSSIVRVQLKDGFGECWEATYPTASASQSSPGQFKAKSE